MKTYLILFLLIFLPVPGLAEDQPSEAAKSRNLPPDYQELETEPKIGPGIQKYAVDAQAGAQKKIGLQPVHDNEVFAFFSADRLEYQTGEGRDLFLWDVLGWVGRDYNKLYLESEGSRLIHEGEFEELEVELLYGRNIATFWDFQAGIRHDFEPHPSRTFAALGLHGLAPYWFEVDATAYLSEDGDISAAFEAEYDMLLSQKLILQPRLEFELSLQDVPEYETWQGITHVTAGLRLRYEIRRELAPYIGVTWTRALGETANRIEDSDGDIDSASFVAGIKFWF